MPHTDANRPVMAAGDPPTCPFRPELPGPHMVFPPRSFAQAHGVNLLFGFSAALPYEAILLFGMAAGFIAQGNFSNLTSGVLMAADPLHRGATVALYSCIGFAGGFGGTLVFGIVLDQFGGAGQIIAGSWRSAHLGRRV